MSSGQTSNYQLSQWQSADRVLMAEFNQDHQKIDAALATLAGQVSGKADSARAEAIAASVPKFTYGAYTGDEEASRIISLPFTPKAVLLVNSQGLAYSASGNVLHYGGLALAGVDVYTRRNDGGANTLVLGIVENGFRVAYVSLYCSGHYVWAYSNSASETYSFIAIG